MRITTKYSFFLSCIALIFIYDTDKIVASGSPACKFKCRGQSGSLLKLEEGTTYFYNLEGSTETLLPKSKGPFGEVVKLGLKAKVEVSAQPQCKTIIQLRNVQITGPDGKAYQSLSKLEQHPLVVSLHGGRLESETCAVHDDDFASLNIKRAVASLLQANTGEHGGNSQESDVFGVCPTHFRVTKDGDSTIVTKHRNLEKCQFRESLRQPIFAIAHGHSSEFQATPLLDSQYEVEQRIKNGVVESVTAKEEYLLRPFSNRDNGAKTKVITKMILESKNPAPPPAFANNEPRHIFFENPHETITCNIQTLTAAIHKVADVVEEVPITAAKDLKNLVKLMRRASKEDLLSVYGKCKAGAGFQNRQLAKKVFTDALFSAGSADSVAAAVELLKSNEITGDLAKLWYLSFAFVRHTSGSALASAMTLLENQKLPFEAYLGVGALAGHYCREHICDGIPQFDQLLAKFSEIIGAPAKVPRDKENYVIAALKGLGNIKHLNDETANKITQVLKDSHVSSRVRVAALETAKTDACRGKLLKGASDIFYNREEDSELRIKAFLVLVECPNPKLANKLNEFLETEPVNQVGAYVTSFLRNLRSSYNPDKEALRDILYNVKPKRKYPFDVRKFSQNHEFSYNFDALSTSAGAEANVIFSQKSYVPRSVNLNLTVEVFGHAFNVLELNGRAENLERIYEKYFGPKGYINTHKPIEIIKDARNLYKDIESRIDGKYKNLVSRNRRSISRPDIDRFGSKVKLYNSKMDYNIDVDLSMKVLGNELSWVNIEDIETPITPSVVIDKVATFIENGIGSARDYRKDLKNHFQFLDTELVYPTSLGIPVRLSAVGSGVVHLKLGSHCDVSSFLKDPKNGQAKVEIIPSTSVAITGELSVDGYVVEAGVKIDGNLHSSTGTDLTLKMLDGHGFDLQVGLPVKKSDIITVNTELFSFIREQGLPSVDHLLEFNVPRKDYEGCFDQLQPFVGLHFCGEIGFPNDERAIMSTAASYPLNGHSKLSLRLEKEDETLTTYHMKLFFDLKNPKNRRIEVKLDTPNTKTQREISFLASLVTEPEKAIDIQFVSPIHKFAARGAIIENDQEYSISGFARIDEAQEYKAKLGLLNKGASYVPILEYTPLEGVPTDVRVDGEVMVDKQPGSSRKKYTFRGVRLIHPKATYTVDGTIETDKNIFGTDLKFGYDKYTTGVKTKFEQHGIKDFQVAVEFSPSQYPDLNFGVDYAHKREDNHIENKLILTHGQDMARNKLSLFQQLYYKYESLQNFDVSTKNTISYPLLELEGKFDGSATRKTLTYDVELKYNKYSAHSKLNAKTGMKDIGDYDINFVFGAFEKELLLDAKREVVDRNKSRFTQKLEIKPGKTYDVAAEVTHSFGGNEVKLTIVATSTNYPNYALDAGIFTTPALFDGHCKILDGSKDVVNGFLKFARTAPFFGSFKLFVDKQIDSQGEYKLHEGKVTGTISAHFIPVNNNFKGSADLMKAGNKYTGIIQAVTDHEGQPKWQLHVETDTDLTPKSINSKNKIKISEKLLELNFHGENEGKDLEGNFVGGYEVTLPTGKFFTGHFKRGLQYQPRNLNAELFIEMGSSEQKGGPLTKFFLDTYAKNFDIKKYSVDSKFEVGRECPEGNIKFTNLFRSMPHEQTFVIDEESSLSGTMVKMPFEHKGHAVLSRAEINFDVNSKLGDYQFKNKGKVLTGLGDKVRHLECMTEINTPHEKAKRILLENLFHFAQGDENKAHVFQVKQEYTFGETMFKLNGDAELHRKHGSVKGSLMLPNDQRPSNIDLNYKRDSSGAMPKAEVSLTANYDNDKNVHFTSVFDYKTDLDLVNGHITGQSTLEHLKTFDIQFSHKKLSTTARNTEYNVIINGEKTEGFAKIDIAPKQPVIDITSTSPTGKTRFYYKLVRKGDRQANSEGQLMWTLNGGGQVDFSSNLDVESYDNFHILVKINSEKLNLNKFKFEVANKAGKSGAAKKINFAAQTADKKGFSGSVTYAVKESDQGFTIEGKGNIEFQNEKLPLTYKGEYKTLTKAADNEIGTSFTLNADFEKGSFIFQNKFSDKELLYTSKFCKDNHCAVSELKNKLEISDYVELSHDASIVFQNNWQGRNDDFKAFSKTHRKMFTVDHETGVKIRDRSYNMKYYVHEGEGGLVIDLPQREVAALASYDFPIDLVTGKPKADIKNLQVRFDGSLYLDKKNKPDVKGNVFMSGDFSATSKALSTKGEIKVSHPALHKDLVIRGHGAAGVEDRLLDASMDIDIFNRKNQRIGITMTLDHFRANNGHNVTGKFELISKGMNLDLGSTGHLFANELGISAGSFVYYHDAKNIRKEAGALLETNPKRFFAYIKVPNRELFKVDSNIQGSPENQVIDTEVNFAELRYYTARIETVGLHDMKAMIHRKDTPDKKLEIAASVSPKLLEFKADKTEGGAKDNLIAVTLTSNKNTEAKPNFEINSEKIKHVMREAKMQGTELAQQIKNLLIESSKQYTDEYTAMVKGIKKVQPDFKPLLQHYTTEFEGIFKELSEDTQFKEFSTAFKNIFGGMIESLQESVKKLIVTFEKVSQAVAELQVKYLELLKEYLEKSLESYEKLLEPLMGLLNQMGDTACAAADYVLDFIKAHEAEIKHALIGISGYVQEFAQFCINTMEHFRHEAENFFKVVVEKIKSMPIYESIKERYKELTSIELPQVLKNFYAEFTFAADDMLKAPELKNFFENLMGYIIKFPVPSFLVKLPKFGAGLKELTFVRYLKTLTELPTLTEIYYTYRPFLKIEQNIPPQTAHGMILNSHHFFTFDQKHYTFKGGCSYILAQDFLDGNFSIVANIENAKIKSISMSDRNDMVEMFNDHTVSVNGQPGDYPVHVGDFSGYARYGTFNMKHKSGVHITKYFAQDLFIFRISGFYFGRIRGLLGTISNEHYDDYLLPNGHVAKDATEFANSYKVMDSCPAGTEYPPAAGHAEECNKLFNSESDLRSGFNFIDHEIYREACDMHVGIATDDKQKAACDVASAFVLSLKQGYMPYASLPQECIRCSVNGQSMGYGQDTTIQSPQGKADVVIVFEQSAFNSIIFKELITPLISTLSHELKEKGLGDVEFALIGYGGPDYDGPVHYNNNGKITYTGKADKINFKAAEDKEPKDEWEKRFNCLVKFIKIELGRDQIVMAMQEANIYPFRQGAAKIILLANSEACPLSPIFPFSLQLPRFLSVRKLYNDYGFNFHFITPMSKSMTLANKPDQELKNIVGFDSKNMYTFADAKKKDLEGDATDRPHLIYDNDLCTSFAQQNGGAAFNANVFTHAKPEQQKKFVQVMAKRIAKGAVEHRYTENCVCRLYHGIFSYPECKVVEKV